MSGWQLGNVRIDRVVEFEMPMIPGAQIFPTSTPEAIERHRHWLDTRGIFRGILNFKPS